MTSQEQQNRDRFAEFGRDGLLRAIKSMGFPTEGNRLDQLVESVIKSGVTPTQVEAALQAPAVDGSELSGRVDSVQSSVMRLGTVVDALVAANASSSSENNVSRDTLASAVSTEVAVAVAAAFQPIVDALQAAPPAVVNRVVAAAPRERRPISEVFDLPGVKGECEVWGPSGKVDASYVWNLSHLRKALRALERGDNVWLAGERGTGKTQFVMNLAARLGRPFFRVSFDANLERSEFIGADGLANGATAWQDGVVLQAYRTPGAICLLDEVSMGRSEYITALHALLEPSSTFSITSSGEQVYRAPGMVFFAADNTCGSGDATGRYAGTRVQNAALVDRFSITLKLKFLLPQEEIDLLVARGADRDVAGRLINVFSRCRAEVGGLLVEPPSLRNAFAFCAFFDLDSPAQVWEDTVVNKSPEESQEALRQLFAAHFEKRGDK